MKYLLRIFIVLLSFLNLSCGKKSTDVKLTSLDDSLSYYQGIFAAWKLRESGYRSFDHSKFDEGIEQSNTDVNSNFEKKMEAGSIITQKLKANVSAFFEKNKNNARLITTPSGLQYEVIQDGDKNSNSPALGDSIKLSLKGYRIDGAEFQSFKGNMVFTGRMAGFREGISLMKRGSKYKFYIPPHLGIGNDIELTAPSVYRNMPSIYEIEIVDIYPVK